MLIGITGRIGAGKETLTKFFRDNGFNYYETSKILKDELIRIGVDVTRSNMQDLGDKWRKEDGPGALMKRLLEKIDKSENCIIDSLRNSGEIDFLKNNVKDFVLVAVDADQKLRFERIVSRGKLSDPKTWEEFLAVDERDYFDPNNPNGQQVGKCIKRADYLITNNGEVGNSMKEIENIWEEIKEKC
jgi:dephospho-CoA kinase